jgi:PAS domain S-box-containing protein
MADAGDLSYRLLFEANPTPMWVFDRETLRFLVVNEAAIARYGYAREEFLSMTILDVRPPGEADEVAGFVKRKLGDTPDRFTAGPLRHHRTKSGEVFAVHVHVAPVTFAGRPAALAVARDISAQTRAERERDLVERRLRAIVDHAADAISLVEPNGVTRYVSPGIERLLGYRPDELVGRSAGELVHPEDRVAIPPLPAPGATSVFLCRSRHKDGSWRWLESIATNLTHDPDVGAYLTNVRDVTARVHAEQAALESRRRLEFLLSATRAVTYTCDAKNGLRCTFMSKNVRNLLGHDARRFVEDGRFWWDSVHPDDQVWLGEVLSKWREVGHLTTEYRFRHADGTWRWMQDEAELVRDSAGNPAGLVGYWADVTERRNAEELMRRSERNFRSLIERTPSAVFVHREGRVVYANPACAAMLGYEDGEQLRGTPCLDLVLPEDHDEVRARMSRTFTEGGSPPAEIRMLRRDGSAVVIETVGVRLEFDGELANVVLARDLTERREIFARLAVAERMLSVGTLAAGVAHEINNPLSFVITNLALLEDALVGPNISHSHLTPADLATLLRDAREGASRVAAIVRDLRALSRADEDTRGPVDVREVLRLALKMAHGEIRHRARVVEEIARELPPVSANASRLGQVFLNLLVNAAQAIPAGNAHKNEIRIRARPSDDGASVVVEVEDTGAGIPPSVQGRIFDPFFTTKPIGQGTGLGLAICHGIVTRFGGEITLVSSAPGVGTCFRVALPAAVHASPAAGVASTASPAPRSRILLVDDEASLGTTIRLLLQPEHEVVSVTRAHEALELLKNGTSFDVILCDLMMPEVSGMDFHGELASLAPDLVKRVVFLTGGAFTEQAHAFLSSLPNAYLEKPFTEADLKSAIWRVRLAAAAAPSPP